VAGLWLGVAVLAKTNAVIFWSLPVVFLLFEPACAGRLVENLRTGDFSTALVLRSKSIKLTLAALASGGAVMGLVMMPLALIFKEQFWAGIGTHPGLFLVMHPRANLALLWEYVKVAPWWLSWLVVGMMGVGATMLLYRFLHSSAKGGSGRNDKNIRLLALMILALGVGQVFLLGWWYFSARNFLLASSSGFLLIALATSELFKILKGQKANIILGIITVLVLVSGGLMAFEATQHEVVEESLEWVRENNKEGWSVYTTFDAEKLTEIGGFKVKWLNEEMDKPAWVITDREKTGRISSLSFLTFREAKEVMKRLKEESQPLKVFVDEKSLFPVSREQNVVKVYQVK
jgi:hypothetical protein